ncbi:hypothetical protein UU9_08977, partial [Rhodanobacter fulvus Jip2]
IGGTSVARDILLRAVMGTSDDFDSRYLSQMDSDETRQSALQFLSDHNVVTPDGMLYEVFASDADRANSSLGAFDLMKDENAYADVMHAMNPTNDPSTAKALTDYFDEISFDESFKDWRNKDALNFLSFQGQIALAGGSGGLAGGVPFLGAANAVRNTKTVGSIAGYALASRGGAAAISGATDVVSQLLQGDKFRWTNVGVATAGGRLGCGRWIEVEYGGWRWRRFRAIRSEQLALWR